MDGQPRVTVVVPVRNGAPHLPGCIGAIAAQDIPRSEIEVLVVDGGSVDASGDVARQALDRRGLTGDVVIGEVGTIPANMNAGLAKARGEILCRVDVRSRIPPEYVRTCVELLARPDVVATGGCLVPIASAGGPQAAGIARAHNNRWGMGLGRYRAGWASGPADTVYLGAARAADLRSIGGWDDRLLANQDFDLNRRLSGLGTVWSQNDLRVEWLAPQTWGEVLRRYHRFGRWKVRYWRLTGDPPRPRQWALLLGPPALAAAGVAATLAGRNRLRRLAGLGAAGAVGLLALDAHGSSEPARGQGERAVSATTLALVGAGWLSGIVRELPARR